MIKLELLKLVQQELKKSASDLHLKKINISDEAIAQNALLMLMISLALRGHLNCCSTIKSQITFWL